MSHKVLVNLSAALVVAATMGTAWADCYEEAGQRQRINPQLLKAVAIEESGERQIVSAPNHDGSVDYCMMQVSSTNIPTLEKFGITKDLLMQDQCTCIQAGAWVLGQFITRYGNTWAAIAAYNNGRPIRGSVYAQRVYHRYLAMVGEPPRKQANGPVFAEDIQ